MRQCRICNGEIMAWQSYHIDGQGGVHSACEYGRTPPVTPRIAFHSGDKIHASRSGEGLSPKYRKKVLDLLRPDAEDDKRMKRTRKSNGQYDGDLP
jgi:hypothetical protein